jgi:hypothetical protein
MHGYPTEEQFRAQQELLEEINRIAEDNVTEIIRFGEFCPTDEVLDLIIKALTKYDSYADIVWDAFDGDESIAKYIVEMHLSGEDEADDTDNLRKFMRRSKQLLRENAEKYLQGIEDEVWGYWHNQAVPAGGYI